MRQAASGVNVLIWREDYLRKQVMQTVHQISPESDLSPDLGPWTGLIQTKANYLHQITTVVHSLLLCGVGDPDNKVNNKAYLSPSPLNVQRENAESPIKSLVGACSSAQTWNDLTL
jgi:hypothetical protein